VGNAAVHPIGSDPPTAPDKVGSKISLGPTTGVDCVPEGTVLAMMA
jgi:hypothetical protein